MAAGTWRSPHRATVIIRVRKMNLQSAMLSSPRLHAACIDHSGTPGWPFSLLSSINHHLTRNSFHINIPGRVCHLCDEMIIFRREIYHHKMWPKWPLSDPRPTPQGNWPALRLSNNRKCIILLNRERELASEEARWPPELPHPFS